MKGITGEETGNKLESAEMRERLRTMMRELKEDTERGGGVKRE